MSGAYNIPASKYNTLRGRPKLLPQSNSATCISSNTTALSTNTAGRQTESERTPQGQSRKDLEGGTERTRKEVKRQPTSSLVAVVSGCAFILCRNVIKEQRYRQILLVSIDMIFYQYLFIIIHRFLSSG